MNDAKQDAIFVQLWDRTGLDSALGRTALGALAGEDAIATVAAQLQRDAARRAPKGPSNISNGEFLKIEAGEKNAFWVEFL